MRTGLFLSALLIAAAGGTQAQAAESQTATKARPAVYAKAAASTPIQNVGWRRAAYRSNYGGYYNGYGGGYYGGYAYPRAYSYNTYRPYYGGYNQAYSYGGYYPNYGGYYPNYGGYYGGYGYGPGVRYGWRRGGYYW